MECGNPAEGDGFRTDCCISSPMVSGLGVMEWRRRGDVVVAEAECAGSQGGVKRGGTAAAVGIGRVRSSRSGHTIRRPQQKRPRKLECGELIILSGRGRTRAAGHVAARWGCGDCDVAEEM